MKVYWVSEIHQNKNICILFRDLSKAIETITNDMLKENYYPSTKLIQKQNENVFIPFFNEKKDMLMWSFILMEVL